MTDYDELFNYANYQIRSCSRSSGYHCILWARHGSNIFVSSNSWNQNMQEVYRAVVEYQKGNSHFKSVEELHKFAYDKLGYATRFDYLKNK